MTFVQDDILDSKLSDNQFDYVFDRGCFHTLEPSGRAKYVCKVASLLKPGGILFLKTFSVNEPRNYGPYQFSAEMIKALFDGRFEMIKSFETVFQGTLPVLPKALFAALKKR